MLGKREPTANAEMKVPVGNGVVSQPTFVRRVVCARFVRMPALGERSSPAVCTQSCTEPLQNGAKYAICANRKGLICKDFLLIRCSPEPKVRGSNPLGDTFHPGYATRLIGSRVTRRTEAWGGGPMPGS